MNKAKLYILLSIIVGGAAAMSGFYFCQTRQQKAKPTLSPPPSVIGSPASNFEETSCQPAKELIFYSLCLPNEISQSDNPTYVIYTAYSSALPNKYLVRYQLGLNYKNQKMQMMVDFQPAADVSLDQLKNDLFSQVNVNVSKIGSDTTPSMGDAGSLMDRFKYQLDQINSPLNLRTRDTMAVERFISYWPSGASRDILVYRLDLRPFSNQWFDSVVVTILNVWPNSQEFPAVYEYLELDDKVPAFTEFVNNLIKNGDERAKIYALFDQVIKNSYLP